MPAAPDEHLDTDDLYRLYAEVIMGIGAEGSTLPDTPLVRKKRAKLVEGVAAIRAEGYTPDVPHEWEPHTPNVPAPVIRRS